MKVRWVWIFAGMALCATSGFGAERANRRVIDLGEGEIFGDLKRPQIRWVDSSAVMRQILPRIHARKFADLEAELLRPLSRAEWRKRMLATGGRR